MLKDLWDKFMAWPMWQKMVAVAVLALIVFAVFH